MVLFELPTTLNIVVTGQVCCGDKYLSAILCDHPKMTCHSVLLDPDDAVRRYYHESYFGDAGSTPDWLVEGHISGEQYLTNKIFDNPLNSEEVIGVSVLYPHLYARDLWDYFSGWDRTGDFCLIHLKRNPVACFASLKIWENAGNVLAPPSASKFDRGYTEIVGHPSLLPARFFSTVPPIHVDLDELYSFVREHLAAEVKVATMCEDRLELSYEELMTDFSSLSPQLFSFLGSPPLSEEETSRWDSALRLKAVGRSLRNVIANWYSVCAEAPQDIKPWLDPEAI